MVTTYRGKCDEIEKLRIVDIDEREHEEVRIETPVRVHVSGTPIDNVAKKKSDRS